MSTGMGLAKQFPSFPNEGTFGYIRRLAHQNSYDNWKSLLRGAGVNPSLNALFKNAPLLERALGLPPSSLSQPTSYQPYSSEHDLFFFRMLADPVCPQCLVEEEYLRQSWQHCFVNACPTHGTVLIDVCPVCTLPLTSNRFGIVYCDCGYDLRHASTDKATAVQLWVSARLQGDWRECTGIPEIGTHSDYVALARLLFMLCTRFDPENNVRPSKVSLPKTVVESLDFLKPVEYLLTNWPVNFAEHVSLRLRQGNQTKFGLSARLGAWYGGLYAMCRKQNRFPPLWRVFSDVVVEKFDGNLRGESVLDPSPNKVRTYLSVKEAAKMLGVSGPTLASAIERGFVDAHVSRQGGSYTLSLISQTEISRLRELRSRWVPESEAARRLGVHEAVLRTLVEAGVVRADVYWRATFLKTGPVCTEEFAALEDRLSSWLLSDSRCTETLALNQLTARRTLDRKALQALYRAIFEGKLRPVGRDDKQGIGGFLFPKSEVLRYLGSVALSGGLTLLQVEHVTGWKYEALAHWVQAGLLDAEQVELHGKVARVVNLASLMAFRREWIPVSELALTMQTTASAVTRKLESLGVEIHGQKLVAPGVHRGGLVALASLARTAFGPSCEAKTTPEGHPVA